MPLCSCSQEGWALIPVLEQCCAKEAHEPGDTRNKGFIGGISGDPEAPVPARSMQNVQLRSLGAVKECQMDILVSSLRPPPAVTSSRVATHTLSLSRNSPLPHQPGPTTASPNHRPVNRAPGPLASSSSFLGGRDPAWPLSQGPSTGAWPFWVQSHFCLWDSDPNSCVNIKARG